MTKSWVSSLCRLCLVLAALLIGVTARADLANQDWSGTPPPWPPVQGLNPPPPPRTWVKEVSTSATTYSTTSSGPAIPTPNPAGYLPSAPFGSFTTTSNTTDYGITYYYNDAGDNVVDSIQTVDIAVTGAAIQMSLVARRQDGSSGTHYGVLVGGTDHLVFFKKVNWTFTPIGPVVPADPAYGVSLLQTGKWYRLYFMVKQLSSGCPNNKPYCTELRATLWDLANPNPPDYTFSSTTPWTLTSVLETEDILQNHLGRTALFFRTGGASNIGYFDNYRVKSSCDTNSECGSGFCADGVCCNQACGAGNTTDCLACSVAAGAPANGTCATISAGHVCRPAVPGGCDIEETCDGSSSSCPPDAVRPAGTTCGPECSPQATCNGANTCPNLCCTPGTDTDDDRIDDCTEMNDGDAWTDLNIFNGMHGRLADQCHSAPACSQTDTLAEVDACMNTIIEDEKDQSSGWDWENPPDNVCSSSYDFHEPWSQCNSLWEADWKGFIKLDNDGYHCFEVIGSNDKACASVFFDTETTAVTHDSGANCFNVNAGVYPIRWFYEMGGNSQSDFHLAYCYSRDGTCTPSQALPNNLLRPTFTGNEQLCDPDSNKCSDLCPCSTGQGTCTADSQCKTGQVCGQNNGSFFGRPATDRVCWFAGCSTGDPIKLGCGSASSACGTTCLAATPCSTDSDCVAGYVCGQNNGVRFDAPPGVGRVCWPATCATDQKGTGCGNDRSPCGRCECTPQCANAQCGGSTDDGCGGRCVNFCADREPGCSVDADCQPGSVCVQNGGPRIGLPSGTNVCLPARCNDLDPRRVPDCGSTTDPCGTCPPCVPDCTNRQCGPDPRCGADCGALNPSNTCAANQCSPAGTCIDTFIQDTLQVPVPSGGSVDVPALTPPPEQKQTVGALAGDFSVSDKGTAVYSVPIVVPPGRAGIEPDLHLRYESSKSNGLLGVGWSIDGLSMISRCSGVITDQAYRHDIDYTTDDRLCLDGKRLVAVHGDYWASGTEYRTDIESFTRIMDRGGYFEARTREGKILFYGGSSDSKVFAHLPGPSGTGGFVRAWALDQVSDHAGNFLNITYSSLAPDVALCNLQDGCSTEEIWPIVMSYGGFDAVGQLQEPDR